MTFSLSTLHINLFPTDSLLKNKADDKCRLKFGAERVKGNRYTFMETALSKLFAFFTEKGSILKRGFSCTPDKESLELWDGSSYPTHVILSRVR